MSSFTFRDRDQGTEGGKMETATVGKVVVPAKIENVIDLYAASRGEITPDQVRRVEKGQSLIGNPEHGGEFMFDMF